MKSIVWGLLLSTILMMMPSAFAQGNPWESDANQEVALQIIRASLIRAEGYAFQQVGTVTMQVGKGMVGAGATVFAVDVALNLAGLVEITSGAGFYLAAGSTIVMAGGTIVAVVGAGVYGLGKMIAPTETAMDQLDDYFLSSKEAFNEFLDGPIEQQRDLIRVNKRMRGAVLGLAAAIVEQSQNVAVN